MRCIIILHQLTTDRNKLLVDPSRCRYTGSNRIISFVLIKQKKIFSHAATEKNPTEKGAWCTCRVMFCSFKSCLNLFDLA